IQCRQSTTHLEGPLFCTPFKFFLEKKIILADVHMANIAFVNRDDPDFASGIPIIVDPGHAVFLSREYSEVPVKGVGAIGS
ncbi:MAG: hypothetical protein HQM05_15395, partial [Magnetococcales bacterium]|nr:hypothetical protein [Magnetococcales bacterium]